VGSDPGQVHPPAVKFDNEQDYSRFRPTVSTVRKSHASIPPAGARKKAVQPGPLR
jgi:hypothetical protein